MFDLKFSYNWNNKLDCHAFTTIRLYNTFLHKPGEKVKLFLKEKEFGTGTICAINPFLLEKLNPYMAWLDMGYNATEATGIIQKMYPKVDFRVKQLCFLLIVKDKEVKNDNG